MAQRQDQIPLKVAFNGDIHRTRVDLRSLSLEVMTQLIAKTFRLPVGEFVVQFVDIEGDCVNVTTDAEFEEALCVLLNSAKPLQSLKFSAATRHQIEFQEQVTAPLVKSVELLMQALGTMLEQLKGDANFSSCATTSSAKLAQSEHVDSLKTAASGFSTFAQGLVGQINRLIPEKKNEETTAVAAAASLPSLESKQKQSLLEPVMTTMPPVLMTEATPAQKLEELPPNTSSAAFSEKEVKWAEQLSIVRGIFPNAKPAHVIDILEKRDGNLNVMAQRQDQIPLKVAFNGDIHRTRVDLRSLSLEVMTQLIAKTFRLPVGEFVVQFVDIEGDCVNVTTDAEFEEALCVLLNSAKPLQSLKFSAATRHQIEFQEQVTAPLVKSVELLMQALGTMLEQLKGDANFSSCATTSSAKLAQSEHVDSLKTAASGFSTFAQGLVGQINRLIPEKKNEETTAVAAAASLPSLESKQKQSLLEPVMTTMPPVLMTEATPAQKLEELPPNTSSAAFSEKEVKWAEQLSIVRGIFPNAKPAHVIDILEKRDGNLNVVLNILTEEN
ncbi:hypothetical protein CCR75_008380 [Bremia lactucae]|uniref:PB1 domain-containing protein n=1 Tax=Bremia lactucae TaxID=4779 RepID=A0A976IJL1_BRELC|nr:hypothetical protein CCR75_008380 [Bremia lactucae]